MSFRTSLCLGVLLAGVAAANPRTLPFTYQYETQAKGATEIETLVDLTPVESAAADGPNTWSANLGLTVEIEYGVTDKLELAFYFAFIAEPGQAPFIFDGVKQRLRYRLAEQGEWPVDVSLYFEVAEMYDELELEAKVNLQRRLGPVRLLVNLWAEREFHYDGTGAWVLNPTGGVDVELSPNFYLGAEYWMRAELGAFTHHYLGPALSLRFKNLWWSVAAYLRLDGLDGPIPLDEQYGRLWVRSVVGVNL